MIHNLLVAAQGMMAPHKRARKTQLKVDRDTYQARKEKRKKKKRLDFVILANVVVFVLAHILVSLVFHLLSFECRNH